MKILVTLSRFPWPIEKGDKLRAFYQLQGLAKDHEVHLVTLNDEKVPDSALKALSFCKSITVIPHGKFRVFLNLAAALWNNKPFQVNYFRSPGMYREIERLIDEKGIEVVYVQLIRLGMNLPFHKKVGWMLDYMDAFSIGMEKRIEQSNLIVRPFARKEARRLKNYESRIAAKFDELSIISERDADALPDAIREATHIIPNGVGESFFARQQNPDHHKYDLIFFGNMGYHPNVQSARFLIEEVIPETEKLGLKLRICIAGARPAPLIRSYAGERVEVTGLVDDIRDYIVQSKLAIAPLVSGQGLQNKLLESMAMGVPTLTTPLANSALHATSGKEIMVCRDAKAFAIAIRDLLEDPEKAATMASEGKTFVEKNFRWDAMNRQLETALKACLNT